MNFLGLAAGVAMILLTWWGHVLVIQGEYHLGKGIWPLFLLLGLGCLAASLAMENPYASTALGIASATLFWSIHEIFRQEERVRRGQFPRNPRRRG